HVPVPARPSTPQLKSVPNDHIEQELAVILNGIQHHHTTHPVDPKDAEDYQKRNLGPFFKRTLPYHRTVKDISLVMLGLELDKKARTTTGETLRSIVEDDIGAQSGSRVVTMVAPSGSGKTATVIDLATKHFVIYCVCSTPRATVSPDFNDINFITLATDVEKMYMAVVGEEQGNLFGIDERVKALTRERVELEFLARLLFLHLLLNHIPGMEPRQFFREQTTTGGASTIGTLVYKLREYNTLTIEAMLRVTQTKLHSHLVSRRLGLVIAVDEAQVTENDILEGKLISPSALIDNRNNKDAILDGKNQVQLKYRHGLLMPLSTALSSMRATVVILGTALSLQNADHVYSALDKTINFTRITDFPQFDSSDVNKMISDLVDLSDCEIPPAKLRKLSGRPRFSLGIIKRLIVTDRAQFSKQATIDSAIDRTIEHVEHGLRDGVRRILENDKTAHVVEAVEEELKTSGKDSAFMEYLDQLYQIVTNFGVASTSKGDALEPLVRRSLQLFNGLRLVDLPFLQGIALPKWCNNLQLQIDEINTANGFGYTASGQYAGSLAIKFYSSSMSQSMHKENETSSDIRACFLKTNGEVNKSLAHIRRAYEDARIPSNIRGILRIHLEFPDVQQGMPATHIRRNPMTGVEDVMVYINLSMLFSKASLAFINASILLLLTAHTEAHSYTDCIDWHFNSKNKSWADSNGHCAGYARRFPLGAKKFAKLDSDDTDRLYQQSHNDPDEARPPCSNGRSGEESGADETTAKPWTAAYNGKDKHGQKTGTYTITKVGGNLCIRWPAMNHAVPGENDLSTVNIGISDVNLTEDPSQEYFNKNIFARLDYKNCTKGGSTNTWPCGGCFKIPTSVKPGHHLLQWHWRLNKNEWYTSCADHDVKAKVKSLLT
ncbi:hypothetical protein BGZ81_000835, partial [Podila clonocystis]